MLQAQALDNRLVATTADDVLVDRIVPGAPLVIAFGFVSWTTRPAFDFYGRLRKLEQASGQPLNKILVRDSGNAWYHRRIAGLGNHVDETAQALRELVRRIAPSQITTVGQSMGAYAAVMYGLLLDVQQIVAFGPLSFLDVQQARLYHELRWLPVMESLAQDPPASGYYDLAALCRARATDAYAAAPGVRHAAGRRPTQAGQRQRIGQPRRHARAAPGRLRPLHPASVSPLGPRGGAAPDRHEAHQRLAGQLHTRPHFGAEPMPDISREWRDWVAENLRLGCAGEQLVAVLQQHGFSLASSIAAVDAAARAKAP